MQKKCFVIMPFSKTTDEHDEKYWNEFYNVLESNIESYGYECKRSEAAPNNIMNSIIDQLKNAELVVAILTDYNSNVWYELGIRHALKKRGTIMLIENNPPWPFDISSYGVIHYSTKPPAGSHNLILNIKKFIDKIEDSDEADNPVHTYLEKPKNRKSISNESNWTSESPAELKQNNKIAETTHSNNEVDVIWYNIDLEFNKDVFFLNYQEIGITIFFINNAYDIKKTLLEQENKLLIISSNSFDSINDAMNKIKNLNEPLLLKRIIIYSNNPSIIKKTEDILKGNKLYYLTSSPRSLFQFVKINVNK